MGNIARVFLRDVKRLAKAPAAWVVVVALIVLPSLYTWFNVAAFWNPYDATGNLTICVVNEDKGADSDTIGHLDMGSQLVEQLSENTQLGWDFVDRETAMEKVRSGSAYAAFVIPSNFSENVTTLLTGDFVQPQIEYYVNEKTGPVTPKITDAGANSLDTSINDAFFSTVSAKIAEVLNQFLAESKTRVDSGKNNATSKIAEAAARIGDARNALHELSASVSEARDKTAGAKSALQDAKTHLEDMNNQLQNISTVASEGNTNLSQFSAAINSALDLSTADAAKAYAQASAALTKTKSAIESARDTINDIKTKADQAIAAGQETEAAIAEKVDALKREVEDARATADALEAELAELKKKADEATARLKEATAGTDAYRKLEEAKQKADAALASKAEEHAAARKKAEDAVNALATAQEELEAFTTRSIAEIDEAGTRIAAAVESAQGKSALIEQKMLDSLGNVQNFQTRLSSEITPTINSAFAVIAKASGDLQTALSNGGLLIDEAIVTVDQLDSTLATSTDAFAKTDKVLADVERDLDLIHTDVMALSSSNALSQIIGEGGVDPDSIADFMKSPTQINAVQLYAVSDYGSSMAPLFMNLTLWIGVFMLMVIVRLEVDNEGIARLTIMQRFFGRGILLAILTTLQACVCCTGCLVMGVQTANAALFYLTAVIAALTYLAVQYTLSTTLQHVGKALCIILVFVQIPGATGLYPIEMTPHFFQVVYPLFPFTYGINAIRETIGGFYGNNWATNIAVLGGFFVAFIAIGALARPYLTNLNRLFAREIEESDIVNGESVQLPARRYRMSEVLNALADRKEYRAELNARVSRFIHLYPLLKHGALIAGIGLPVVATAVLLALNVEKVIILTTWLVWFVIIVVFLIAVEYARDNLVHLASLDTMSADEVRNVYTQRDSYTRVQPIGLFVKQLRSRANQQAGNAADEPEDAKQEASDRATADRATANQETGNLVTVDLKTGNLVIANREVHEQEPTNQAGGDSHE